MTRTTEYEQCLVEMYGLRRFGIILGLETTRNLLQGLDNPQDRFASIHIAGTNGKGSIASFLNAILVEAGYRVGLYTSPHLVRFNERIRIDHREISDPEVLEAYRAVKAVGYGDREPTFFEYTTAMAFYHFGQRKVDWAVIETGMGGRMDSTNVLRPAVSIISNISLEHQMYLGDTLEQIAGEKGGIIKEETPLITGARQPEVLGVLKRLAQERRAAVHQLDRDFQVVVQSDRSFAYQGLQHTWHDLSMNLQGRHQFENAAIALAAIETLKTGSAAHPPVDLPEDAIRNGLKKTKWPGRLEKIMDSPVVILDGAHNLAAIENLAAYMRESLSDRDITLVTGILDDKSYEEMLKHLLPHCTRAILTRSKIERALDPSIMQPVARQYVTDVRIIPDVAEAVQFAIKNTPSGDAVCISGSLYVVGEARGYFESVGAV